MADGEQIVVRGEPFPATQEELLTEQFYAWEKQGRGWHLWSYPVTLEPPFLPFVLHCLPATPAADDARKPTFLSALADKIRARFSPRATAQDWQILAAPEH